MSEYECVNCRDTGYEAQGDGGPPAPPVGRLNMRILGPWTMAKMKVQGPREFLLEQVSDPIETEDPEAWAAYIAWLLENYDSARRGIAFGAPCSVDFCGCDLGDKRRQGHQRVREKELAALEKKKARRGPGSWLPVLNKGGG